MTPEFLNNNLMFAKTGREYTAWQEAALMGNSYVF